MSTATGIRQSGSRQLSGRAKLGICAAGVVFAGVSLLVTGLKPHHDIPLDPRFGTPPPPTGLPYLAANNVWVTIVMTLIGLIGVVVGVHRLVRTKSPLPLLIALSGAFICIPEVFFDIIGGVYFPWSATETAGHAYGILGRQMPWWILAGWFGYGAFDFLIFAVLASKASTRTLWLVLGGAAVGDVVFEEILLKFDVYHYYGNQPLVLISELPWWWIPCNSIGVFLASSLAYRFQPFLQGWRSLLMIVITPLSVSTVYGAIALPSWIAVNGNYPWLLTQVLGLATIALGIVVFALILRLVLGRDPFDLRYAPSKDIDEFGVDSLNGKSVLAGQPASKVQVAH